MVHLHEPVISNTQYTPGVILPEDLFEKNYIACRRKEKRIYTDDEVKELPSCAPSHPHYSEWVLRKKTFQKLQRFITAKKKPVSILEIGCGNGWLSHRLSLIPRTYVTGLDINFTEIQQAARVFDNADKLKFVYGDIRSGILNENRFDIILFAASIQYFHLPGILNISLQHLGSSGEIHIVDSPVYAQKAVKAASLRSLAYYNSLGFPAMADHYFHHTLAALAPFDYEILYDPRKLLNRFAFNPVPFHWIKIKNLR